MTDKKTKELTTGSQILHYRIISKIGAGGMGEVYLVEDTKLDRKVALKILPAGFAEDKDRMSRFVREAKSASALNHPNIITIYEIGEYEGTHFIATEFIDGKTLNEYSKDNSLNFKTALEIAIQVASGLDEAHEGGIVHRDIKPDNVMIRENGLAKILDFGIAKLTEKQNPEIESEDATAIQVNTTPGMIIGTANYMSPEQAKGKDVDARTDIFSFGVVLYEMIAGHLPFEGETAMEAISSIIKDEPKPLNLSEVPPEIERVISKSLRKDRDERYQTIKGLLADLKDVKKELEFQDKLEKTVSPDKEEPKTQMFKATTVDEQKQTTMVNDSIAIKRSSFNKIAVGVLAFLLISAIGVGYWYFSSGNQIESIAVMPFVNESSNEDVEYLSDGMTETLIKSLSNLPNLDVKPRSSVFRYKGKDKDLRTIGEELNVQAILTGRVVKRGDELTLSLELVDVQKDSVIWTESYKRKQSDLVTLQSRIAKDVSTKLKSRLSGAEEEKVTKTATTNPEAYKAYLKGRYYWNRRTAENLKNAIEQFKIAADKDPNYALAYVGLADSYALLNEYAGVPTNETLPQAKAFAERAFSIDSTLAEPHATLGLINYKLWQWAESEKEFKQAIELNPNYSTTYHWYSRLLLTLGRYDESAKMIKQANKLDPLSSIISVNISEMYQVQNNHKASIQNSLKILELDPNFASAYYLMGMSYLKLGRNAEAISVVEKAVQLTNRAAFGLDYLGYVYAFTGKRAEAIAIIKELEAKYSKNEASGYNLVAVYAGLGDKDKAFEWLEKDFQARSGSLSDIRWAIPCESLRDDPRFKDLLKRMGLPE